MWNPRQNKTQIDRGQGRNCSFGQVRILNECHFNTVDTDRIVVAIGIKNERVINSEKYTVWSVVRWLEWFTEAINTN